MPLARDAVRGALWTISAGMGSRAIGLVGTLVVTHFVTPTEYGEVTVAAVLAMTANQLSTVGLGQYIVAKPDLPRSTTFHVTVFHVVLGALALGVLLVLGNRLGGVVEAERMTRFLPGLALSVLFDRIAFVPERILARDLRFGALSATRSAGELAHSVASVTLAALGWGGAAIVMGNVARSSVRLVSFVASVKRRDWLEPARLTLRQTHELFAFGVPMALGALCAFASRRWDNLLVSRFFGPGTTGMYNLAYNLADVPAIQVGEQIGDVLLPSFARMDVKKRPDALVRSLVLLSLVVFPLAVGLAVVAPTLVLTVFDAQWRPVGPMLVVLSALSVTRPVGWTVASYLQARELPSRIFWLEAFKLSCLVLGIVTLGRHGPLWTCSVVGAAFGAHAVASLWLVRRIDGVPLRRSLGSMGGALVACAFMAIVVLATRGALDLLGGVRPVIGLALEVVVGALAYGVGVWMFAREAGHDLVSRVFDAVRRHPGRARGDD